MSKNANASRQAADTRMGLKDKVNEHSLKKPQIFDGIIGLNQVGEPASFLVKPSDGVPEGVEAGGKPVTIASDGDSITISGVVGLSQQTLSKMWTSLAESINLIF